ncbi:MAG: hypothetical protein AB7N54_19480 [Alphaproteobacteria bacterium]
MAGPWYAENLPLGAKSNDAVFTDIVALEIPDAPADSDVLLVWSLAGGTSSTSLAALYRLHHDTAAAVLGENEFEAREASAPVDAYSAHGIARWQTGGTPGSNIFSIEFATGGANNARHENARLLAFVLGVGDRYAEDADYFVTVTDSGTWEQALELNITPATTGDYLILANADLRSVLTTGYDVRVVVDGVPQPTFRHFSKDATFFNPWSTLLRVALEGGVEHTIALEFKTGSGTANTTLRRPCLVALREDAFGFVHYAEARERVAGTENTFQTHLASAPDLAAGDYMVLGSYWFDAASSTVSSFSRLTDDSAVASHHEFESPFSVGNMAVLTAWRVEYEAGARPLAIERRSETTGTTTGMAEAAILVFQPPEAVVAGSLAAAEAPDGLSFVGDVQVGATLAVGEQHDGTVFTGTLSDAGALAVAEHPDGAAFAGVVSVGAVLAAGEEPDAVQIDSAVLASGTFQGSEAADVGGFGAEVVTSGVLAVAETGDVMDLQAIRYRRILARASLHGRRGEVGAVIGRQARVHLLAVRARIGLSGRVG